jgi:two-component system, LytTR family, response regulator
MITAILVDDEPSNIEVLSKLINNYCTDTLIIGTASSVNEASALIREKKPDLVFLDIEMPGKNGFDLIHDLKPISFEIIFITAFDQYATKAFRYSAIDYLLKPVNIDELREALNKAANNIQSKSMASRLQNYFDITSRKQSKIAILVNDNYNFYDYDDIICFTAVESYTHIYFTNGNKIISASTLKHFTELLPGDHFCRVHHAHLVNLNYATKYSGGRSGTLALSNGLVLEVSQRKRNELLKRFGM